MEFNFDDFERIKDEFAETIKVQMQTRCFNPLAPSFDVEVNVYDQCRGYGKRIDVRTSDIASHMNFTMFEEICLADFGGGVMKGESDDLYWLPINWGYQHKGGGGNSCEAFTVYFNDSGEIVKVTG
jgi:hypothetical protein